jgi:TonB family protein
MKKRCSSGILIGLLLAAPALFAQTTTPAAPAKPAAAEQVYTFAEQMPTFQGGRTDSLMTYIRRNTRYPAEAIQAGASGKVFVQFVISKQGRLEQAQVVKGVAPALDQEALRVIETMPAAWQPGQQQGQPVAVQMTVPFSFVMQTPAPAATNGVAAQYPGGPEALLAYLAAAPYPEAARATLADVRVFIKFKIDQTGKVINAKPIGPLMRKPSATPPPRPATEAENQAVEEAATAWIQAMPAWTPAMLDGTPVESDQFILPIIFSPTPPSITAKVYPYANQMPVFGTETTKTDLHTSIQRAAKYPALALRNQVQGTVYLYCVVNETGALEKQQIVGSAGTYLDEAVLTAAQNQPAALAPALHQGKPVKVFYVIPFTFRIR